MIIHSAGLFFHKPHYLLQLFACFSMSTTCVYGMQPGNNIGYYTAQFGQVNPQNDEQVANVFNIFKRVSAVADKSLKRLPKLVVINSKAEPWAIALPDGHIVLSKQAINICNTQIKQTDACLAFILGHELAHLANDDFWHQEVYSFLATHKDTQHIAHFLKTNTSSIETELEADDKGFIYAAMAGYPVADLLNDRSKDFFELWMQHTNSQVIMQGTTKNRSAPLKQRFKELKQKMGFYEFGVRLSHFGYCDDSVYFLKEFQKIFPSREVLNNLGYCYLQMAIRKMEGNRARFYWLPLVLDIETQANMSSRGKQTIKSLKDVAKKGASEQLDKAVAYLKLAINADPFYLPAKTNLAVALLFLGKPLEARVYIQQLRALEAENFHYAELEALAIYEESDAELDRWSNAVKRLNTLIKKEVSASPLSLLYNLARLYEVRAKTEESNNLWQLLSTRRDELPMPIRIETCSKQNTMAIPECIKNKKQSDNTTPAWKWPLEITALKKITPQQTKQLASWDKLKFDWYEGDLYGQIYTNLVNQSQVLILAQFVQMQVVKNLSLGGIENIKANCPQKLVKKELANGIVFSCDQWAVLVRNHEIQEAWWIAD